MIYSLLISGFDPTSLPSTPTNAELLQMISQAQYADNIGGIILSDVEPDSTTYPILLRFRWAKTDGSGGLIGEFYYHDGTSWTLEVPGPGTVTANSLANGTITLDKLYPGGDPYWIIRRNSIATGSPGAGFEMVNITTAISSNTLALVKLVNSSSAERMIVSGPGGVWTDTPADDAFTVLFNSGNFVTAFNSTSDKVPFLRILDDAPCTLTVTNFFTSGLDLATAITVTADSDYVGVWDATDSTFKKVALGNFLPNTGVTAATYAYPASISVNAKGQITAISSSAGAGLVACLKDTGPKNYTPQAIVALTETKIRFSEISTVSWASLASNSITLAAGAYVFDAYVPLYETTGGQHFVVMLYNETSAAVIATATYVNEGDIDEFTVCLKHVLTLAATATLSLRVYADDNCAVGRPANLVSYAETYQQMLITKVS